MSKDNERFDKIFALAVDPGAVDGEALAAFQKMRDLVRANPSLVQPATRTPAPLPSETTYSSKITDVHANWALILVGLLSSAAYRLDLRYKLSFDFSGANTAIEIVCDGTPASCNLFAENVEWCINYVNNELNQK